MQTPRRTEWRKNVESYLIQKNNVEFLQRNPMQVPRRTEWRKNIESYKIEKNYVEFLQGNPMQASLMSNLIKSKKYVNFY